MALGAWAGSIPARHYRQGKAMPCAAGRGTARLGPVRRGTEWRGAAWIGIARVSLW